ncbi:HSPB1-associated protein 1-like isoform X2 [Aethina tumida]|uniref:HSPB1-associated protein 1 isoform X2 n=1 Tax=Aethina tumida TaxID=116153 RepID=UPI002147F0D0|nr:HSPB1-associated protein 1 isoform X2 [Aethina tumida]XP_049817108.1 HSPB1-associated protein 1-like isoform X2 [Aethina tumida]
MEARYKVDANVLKQLIENSDEILLFENFIKCDLINWKLKDWKNVFGNLNLDCRVGFNYCTRKPQFETITKRETLTFEQFLEKANSEDDKWFYYDYKHLNENLNENVHLMNNINWKVFGFPEINYEKSTFWFGSKNSHTSLHQDSYGYNLILQIYGKKMWILFPKEEDLKSTRIPYEESSIYSKLNFFSPDLNEPGFKGVKNCSRIILKPGDVLFVPKKTWHYVENLETSISINTWISCESDENERFNESIVQLLMKTISQNLNEDQKHRIINPNNLYVNDLTFESCLQTMNYCKEKCERYQPSTSNEEMAEFDVDAVLSKYEFIKKPNVLTNEEFTMFLTEQREKRVKIENADDAGNDEDDYLTATKNLIDSVVNSQVVDLIKDKLLNCY